MPYNRCGRSGLELPAISLGLWHNFGDDRPLETQRAIVRRAFDLGITHFDLANNYGPPYGSAEENFGRILARRPRGLPRRARDLHQGRLRHVARPLRRVAARASTCCPASTRACARMGLDYVDIFYSHRFDPDTPLEETMGALDTAVRAGQGALRRHLLLLGRAHRGGGGDPARPRHAAADPPALVLACSTAGSRTACSTRSASVGVGCIAFSPLAQGMLTDKYLRRHPRRLARDPERSFIARAPHRREAWRACARSTRSPPRRGQTLAQMALAWVLRDPRVTSALIGASSVAQLEDERRGARHLDFTAASSPRSTATRSTAGSTSGPAPASADYACKAASSTSDLSCICVTASTHRPRCARSRRTARPAVLERR